jgi:hypothetical protein
VGEYVRLHAAAVSGVKEGVTRAEADFCFDFAHGLVRVLDPERRPVVAVGRVVLNTQPMGAATVADPGAQFAPLASHTRGTTPLTRDPATVG